MTRAQIVDSAFNRLNTESRIVLTPDRINRAFNEVQQTWAMRTDFLSSEVAFDVIAGQNEYNITGAGGSSVQAYKFRRVRYRHSSTGPAFELIETALEDLPEDYNSYRGTPARFAGRGTTSIVLWPPPASSVIGGLLIDTYNVTTDIDVTANGDTFPLVFPLDHREGLINGLAAQLCLMNLEDPTLAGRYPLFLQNFDTEARAARGRAENPGSRSITYAGNAHRISEADRWQRMVPSNWSKEE